MKKNIILTAVLIIIAFVSNINAQTRPNIIKGGLKGNALVLEYERNINTKWSMITSFSKTTRNEMSFYSMQTGERKTANRVGRVTNFMIGGRHYLKSMKKKSSFYIQPNIQLDRFKGFESRADNIFFPIIAITSLSSASKDQLKYIDDNEAGVFKANTLIGAMTFGYQYKNGRFVFDAGFGLGARFEKKRRLYRAGELKVGYAF